MPLALNNNRGSVYNGRMKKRFQRGSVLLEKKKKEILLGFTPVCSRLAFICWLGQYFVYFFRWFLRFV